MAAITNFLQRFTTRHTQNGSAPQQVKGIEKRIPGPVLGLMCGFLTNRERALLLRSCKLLKETAENTLAHKAFQRVFALASGRSLERPIRHGGRYERRGIVCFDYDEEAGWLITGDQSNYYDQGMVKLWDLGGQQLSYKPQRHVLTNQLGKSAMSVKLDMRNKKAFCASGVFDGRVRLWDLESGEEEVREPLGDELTYASIDLNTETISCIRHDGCFGLFTSKGFDQFKEGSPPGTGTTGWVYDAPEIDRVFSTGGANLVGILQIWDRTQKTLLKTVKNSGGIKAERVYYAKDGKKLFISVNDKLRQVDPLTGETIKEFERPIGRYDETLQVLHYSPQSRRVFASYHWSSWEHYGANVELAAWCAESGKLLQTIRTFGKDRAINQIEFDPVTNTLLTASDRLQLWDLDSARLLGEIPAPVGTRVRWDRKNCRLIVHTLSQGKLTVFDYAPAPQERAKAANQKS